IFRFDRRGGDDDLGRTQVCGVVPNRHGYPELGEPSDIGAVGNVAPLNPIAEIMQYLGDAAHADPADPDEMKRADRPGKSPHAARPDSGAPRATPGSRSRTTRARCRVASRLPKPRARAAAAVSAGRSASRRSRRWERVSGVRPNCGMSQPPPASAKARALAV